ncbi:cytochrome P450 [Serendipita vermifera]|nr:cytochrome P450 [Serendipita vermifera]
MDYVLEQFEQFSPLQVGALTVCGALASYALVKAVSAPKTQGASLPGPPQDPLIGNLRHFPADKWYETFSEWQKTYGDFISVRLPGIHMLLVNRLEVAHELLSKRANINSGRTVGYMVNDLMDWGWFPTLRQPDKTHQEVRRMLNRGIGPQRIGSHNELFEDCVKELVLNLQTLRGDPTPLVTDMMARIVIQIAYGEKIWNTIGKDLARLNAEAVGLVTTCLNSFWFVDIFHSLRYLPSWMPGAGFQRIAKRSRDYHQQIKALPWKRLLELHQSGMAGYSLGVDLIEGYGPSDNVRDAISSLYLAGVDSTSSAIATFLHVMFIFPEVAQKVHDEIAQFVCDIEGDLPTVSMVSDRSRLPYTEAVWKECLRWRPSVPLVVPHTSQEDQTIDGYFIPKGTLINPNYGFMLNDPAVWGDPEVFRPERFLPEHNPKANDLPNPTQVIFGFGIRLCPGMYLADRVGFHVAVMTMLLYEILPLEGKSAPKPEEAQYSSNFIRFPVNFECRFVPRSPKAEQLLSSMSLDRRQ